MDQATFSAPTTIPAHVTALAIVVLSSSVVAGVLAHILTGLRAGATIRRDRYAAAVKALVARIEYPYRIRRRTSDDPEALHALAAAGHDLQESLAETRAWIATESTVLSDVFEHCITSLDGPFKQACNDAWRAGPVTSPAEMNLGGFSMGDHQQIITRMERALTYRFGYRRMIPAFLLRRLFKSRGLLP